MAGLLKPRAAVEQKLQLLLCVMSDKTLQSGLA